MKGAMAVFGAALSVALLGQPLAVGADGLSQDVVDLQARVGTVETSVSGLQTQVSTFGSQLSDLHGIPDRVAALEALIGTLSTTLTTRVATLEGLVANLGTQVSTLSGQVTSLGTTVAGFDTRITTVESTVSSLKTTVAGFDTRIATVESTVAGFDTRLTATQSDLSSLKTTVAGFDTRIATTESNVSSLKTTVEGFDTRITTVESSVRGLQTDLATLQANPIFAVGQYVRVELADMNGVHGPHVVVERANLHVRSGSQMTDDGVTTGQGTLTGLGNLFLGYNEEPFMPLLPGERGGSHNLVVGWAHRYSGVGGLVAGQGNTVTGNFASVSGGTENAANGDASSVSGGRGNNAGAIDAFDGFASSVSGGRDRSALGDYDWRAGTLFENQ